MNLDSYPPCTGCNGKGAWTYKEGSTWRPAGTKFADCPFCVGTGKDLPYDVRHALRKDKKAMLKEALAKKEAEAAALRKLLEEP